MKKNENIEKQIEQGIIQFLQIKGAFVEKNQSGEVYIKKGSLTYKMKLHNEGCPDITCFYKGVFIGIEVKKNQEEINHWLKQEERHLNGEIIPKSYHREEMQIKYKQRILKNDGIFILTYQIKEVIDYINELDKKSKNNLT